MSLARQPQEEPPRRPALEIVGGTDHDPLPALVPLDEGSPARGIVWGLVLTIAGFWVPAAILAARLASK